MSWSERSVDPQFTPSWMNMNGNSNRHLMTPEDVDMELTKEQVEDISEAEMRELNDTCRFPDAWFRSNDTQFSACNDVAFRFPEYQLRHKAINFEAKSASEDNIWTRPSDPPKYKMGYFTSQQNKVVYPELQKCLKPDGMNDLVCKQACYLYPNQPGCETIKPIVDRMTRDEIRKKLGEFQLILDPPLPLPPDDEVMVVAASMRSVSRNSVKFSFVDPKTKKNVVTEKTLVDMFKPTDEISVILGNKTGKFVGLTQRVKIAEPPKPPTPVGNVIVKGLVVKVISPDQVQIKYTKPDKNTLIIKVNKIKHGMKLNEIINVNLNKTAPYAFVSIAKK